MSERPYKTYTDQELRNMRDAVFCRPISDESWEMVREHWREPKEIEWLEENQPNVGPPRITRTGP